MGQAKLNRWGPGAVIGAAMSAEIITLCGTAAGLGFIHTILGPDHYLPFIAMSKARNWSAVKTSWITFLCGLGHVASSILLGAIGIAIGSAADKMLLSKLVGIETNRGEIAAWLLTSFGLVYLIWGIRQGIRNRPHSHSHLHKLGSGHTHVHTHKKDHSHVHDSKAKKNITPWILFTIFVFGPCEPLIPVLMFPAVRQMNIWAAIPVAITFAAVTIATMLAMVWVMSFGLNLLPGARLGRFSHAMAGSAILACGIAIHLGL